MNQEIRTDRLRQLAEHLINGKLGHEVFDFSMYNNNPTGGSIANQCGTAGCAIGECPIVWPNEWEFNSKGLPVLFVANHTNVERSGEEFFGLTTRLYDHLFVPTSQIESIANTELDEYATKEDVAANIIRFCELVESGLKIS